MKQAVFLLITGMLSIAGASELRINGGKLDLNGKIGGSRITLAGGTILQGAGTMDGSADVAGVLSPGDGSPSSVDTLTFTGDLVFQNGSSFECYAADHTTLDKLQAGSNVSGRCDVSLTRHPDAIPLYQVIIDGDAPSDYDQFSASPTNWSLSSSDGDLLVSETTGDSDADTLSDKWEYDYFASRTDADPMVDDDTDEMLNWQERVAGTDPLDDTSRLAMQAVQNRSKTNLVISWSSVDGKLYSIYRSTNLAQGTATLLASDIPASAPVNTFTNAVSEWERFYYRVEVQQ